MINFECIHEKNFHRFYSQTLINYGKSTEINISMLVEVTLCLILSSHGKITSILMLNYALKSVCGSVETDC